MRNRFGLSVFGVVAVFAALVAGQASPGQAQKGTPTDPCATAKLPAEIQNKLTTKYAGWKILTRALLYSDQEICMASDDTCKECPGMVTGKFSDDNQIGYFVNLIKQQNGKTWQRILYFHPSAGGFSVETVQAPSRIEDLQNLEVLEKMSKKDGRRYYHIKTDSVWVRATGESRWRVYYWRQGRLKKIEVDEANP
jgi:hypothetical protein